MNRCLETEWLDDLPATDPRAVHARRDLRLVNRIMGHAGIVANALRAIPFDRPPRVAELGAGDGTLLLRVAAMLDWPRGCEIVLVDRHPAVTPETLAHYRERGLNVSVEADDVFEWLGREGKPFDAILATLFLHHFEPDALQRLFALAASRTNAFVACEPRRAAFALAASRLLGLLGCNDVTRHDAVLSVRAGFAGRELSTLWPADGDWTLDECRAGLFSHAFTSHASRLTPHV